MYKDVVLVILVCVTNIGGETDEDSSLRYRFDYSFNEQADGWLKFHRVPALWNDAMIRCHAEGAVLASPVSNQRREALLKLVSSLHQIPMIFTGVHSAYSQGDFASIEGIPLIRMPITWLPGEPDNYENSESCLAMMTRDGSIADVNCDNPLPYVCFKKRTELNEVSKCGTRDKEYKLESRTGSCYKFHRRGLGWSKAYLTCAAEGGHLAIINSEQEALVLKEFYEKFKSEKIFAMSPDICHIGFRDVGNGGSWKTIHGETLPHAGFHRWTSGRPFNQTEFGPEGENCGSILRTGLLNDVWCERILPFICEMKPNTLNTGPKDI